MELMIWVLAACAVGYLIKLSGYLIPARWLDRPAVTRLAAATTIGLLASWWWSTPSLTDSHSPSMPARWRSAPQWSRCCSGRRSSSW